MLDDIPWANPILPMPDDAAWRAELEHVIGQSNNCYMYAAPSKWLREGLVAASRMQYPELGMEAAWLAILVTSQENACRYCYGAARGFLKLMGMSEQRIEQVERDIRMASADSGERELLRFCRNLSRSNPRPSRAQVEALLELGYTPVQIEEVASAVVLGSISNRFATFAAVPLIDADEPMGGWMARLGRRIRLWVSPYPRPLPERDPPPVDGPFGTLVDLVRHTQLAPLLHDMIEGAMNSEALPRRTVAFMFVVIATALECGLCVEASRAVLHDEGVPPDRVAATLQSLGGSGLDQTEALLLPWARETVHYSVEGIQRKTRELATRVDERTLLEAIGVAALANACARLSMLEQ